MRRWATAAVVLGLLAAVMQAGAQDKKPPTIKQVMDKLHKGANPPIVNLKKALSAEEPDWSAIQKTTKDFVILGAALAKNDPPRGDKESWAKLARQYFDNAKAMDDAAEKKDKEATVAARAKLAGSCMACHRAHKGRR